MVRPSCSHAAVYNEAVARVQNPVGEGGFAMEGKKIELFLFPCRLRLVRGGEET